MYVCADVRTYVCDMYVCNTCMYAPHLQYVSAYMYALHTQYVSALLHAGMAQAPYGDAGKQAAAIVSDANSPARLVL